jgi:hypothetical protein
VKGKAGPKDYHPSQPARKEKKRKEELFSF